MVTNFNNQILCGDALFVLKKLPDELVQCVVTSPPYCGLRDYGVEDQLGLEDTPELYVEKMVEIFREVKRVLRKDGTLWLNMGDSYAHSSSGGGSSVDIRKDRRRTIPSDQVRSRMAGVNTMLAGLKPKDLLGMPWRLAFALQADGWWLRSDIIWHKPNPMPESVRDRPTKSHEYLFLMTKSARYFYDQEATKEPALRAGDIPRGNKYSNDEAIGAIGGKHSKETLHEKPVSSKRNKRTVWTIPTQPYPEAHFATFPEKLVQPCVLAGTSEKGCCPECGTPWVRSVERTGGTTGKSWHDHTQDEIAGQSQSSRIDIPSKGYKVRTMGWHCPCRCDPIYKKKEDAVPCIVLDPFLGSGTTALVALKLGRLFVGIELNPEYCKLAEKRIAPHRS